MSWILTSKLLVKSKLSSLRTRKVNLPKFFGSKCSTAHSSRWTDRMKKNKLQSFYIVCTVHTLIFQVRSKSFHSKKKKSQPSLQKRLVCHLNSGNNPVPFLSCEVVFCCLIKTWKSSQSSGLPHPTHEKWLNFPWRNADGLIYLSWVTATSRCHNAF